MDNQDDENTQVFSIRKRQIECLKRMLALNIPGDSRRYSQEIWKLLVLDSVGRDIIAPLFKVGDLRREGVTLHMGLHSDREAIPDVPAVYFVAPTHDNIKRIGNDLKGSLYDQFHVNFVSHVPRHLLEELAKLAIECDGVSLISKVTDQYSSFVSLEDSLFHLNHGNSYAEFHDASISELKAEKNIDDTVDSLFSVIVTLGVVPVIRCPKGDAAEMIAAKLDAKIREHLSNVGNLLENASWNRPVLILLDRNIDLSVMVSHSWTYQALIHDLFGLKMNRVKMEVKDDDNPNKSVLKSFDLECDEPFWAEHAASPFPKVAVEIQTQVKEVQAVINKASGLADGSGATTDASATDGDGGAIRTKDIKDLVMSVPALKEKKKILNMHATIALELIDQINKRNIDGFYQLEEAIMMKPSVKNRRELLSIISGDKGTVEDKLRLFLIYYMAQKTDIESSDFAELKEALQSAGVPLTAVEYLKQIRAFNESWAVSSGGATAGAAGGKKTDFLKSFQELFHASVKYLAPETKDYHVTRVVDAVMEHKETHGVDKFLYLDPQFPAKSAPRKKAAFKEAIVFMIGGGNYVEYQNIQDYAKKTTQQKGASSSKTILYGATEILTPTQFVQQLSMLGPKRETQ